MISNRSPSPIRNDKLPLIIASSQKGCGGLLVSPDKWDEWDELFITSVTTTDENGINLSWSCLHEVVTCSGVCNPLMSLTLDAFRNNEL